MWQKNESPDRLTKSAKDASSFKYIYFCIYIFMFGWAESPLALCGCFSSWGAPGFSSAASLAVEHWPRGAQASVAVAQSTVVHGLSQLRMRNHQEWCQQEMLQSNVCPKECHWQQVKRLTESGDDGKLVQIGLVRIWTGVMPILITEQIMHFKDISGSHAGLDVKYGRQRRV